MNGFCIGTEIVVVEFWNFFLVKLYPNSTLEVGKIETMVFIFCY